MIHRLAGRLFFLSFFFINLMVLLSQHLCLTVDPSREFILKRCRSLCWHLLCLMMLFASTLCVHLCFASDTLIPLSSNLFAQCSRTALPNNALNIKAKLQKKKKEEKKVSHTCFWCWQTFYVGITGGQRRGKNINLIFFFLLLFLVGVGNLTWCQSYQRPGPNVQDLLIAIKLLIFRQLQQNS